MYDTDGISQYFLRFFAGFFFFIWFCCRYWFLFVGVVCRLTFVGLFKNYAQTHKVLLWCFVWKMTQEKYCSHILCSMCIVYCVDESTFVHHTRER